MALKMSVPWEQMFSQANQTWTFAVWGDVPDYSWLEWSLPQEVAQWISPAHIQPGEQVWDEAWVGDGGLEMEKQTHWESITLWLSSLGKSLPDVDDHIMQYKTIKV